MRIVQRPRCESGTRCGGSCDVHPRLDQQLVGVFATADRYPVGGGPAGVQPCRIRVALPKRTPHRVRGNRGSRPGGGDNCDGQWDDMTKTFNTQGDGHDEWLTPKWITDTLGPFELDPCSPGDRRPWDTATYHLSVENDGLNAPWFGRVWCNPPYGRETFKWLDKLASHGNGIALIFARTETKGFHRQVWDRAHSILFLEGRLAFHRVDGTSGDVANAPSCLVAYGSLNTERLRASGFAGKLVSLK